jgi:hypothetical protein
VAAPVCAIAAPPSGRTNDGTLPIAWISWNRRGKTRTCAPSGRVPAAHLARAAAVMVRTRGRTADALRLGYHVSSAHCPDLIPPIAWALGDSADFSSALARMRRNLVAKGWL